MQQLLKKIPKAAPFIVCFTAALFFAYELMQFHLMNPISTMVMRDLGLSAANFGWLSSTYLFADVIFLIPAGIILDRFSARKVILTAMILCIAGTFGLGLSTNFAGACFAHFVSGIGNAFCFLSCIMLISRWFPPSKQALIIGLVITTGMFGGFIAQSPFAKLAEMLSWRNALMVDGLIGIGILALVFLFVYDTEDKQIANQESFPEFMGNLRACLFNRQNVACGLYVSFMNMPLMIIGAVYGSLFLTQAHDISPTTAAFVISMICIGTIIGSPIFGYLGDRGNKKRLMIYGSALSTLVFFIIMYMPTLSVGTLIGLFALLGLFSSSQTLGYPLITAHAKPHLTGTSTSVAAVLIMGLPSLLGPLAGSIMDHLSRMNASGEIYFPLESFQTAFLIFPVGFLIALTLVGTIKEKQKILV